MAVVQTIDLDEHPDPGTVLMSGARRVGAHTPPRKQSEPISRRTDPCPDGHRTAPS